MMDDFKTQNTPGRMNMPSGSRMIKTTVDLPGRKSDSFYSETRKGSRPINDAPGAGVPSGKTATNYPKESGSPISFKDSPRVKR